MKQTSIIKQITKYLEANEIRTNHSYVGYLVSKIIKDYPEQKIQEKLDNDSFLNWFLELMGVDLSIMCHWSGSYSYIVAGSWLEDSNFHTPCNIVQNLMYLTQEQESELSDLTDKMKSDNEGKTWIKSE